MGINLLLVEDNHDDAFFFRLGAKKTSANVVHVTDADQAMAHLANNPLPDVIVLDLVLPGMPIHRFLEWFRSNLPFHGIPLVIHTGAPSVPDDVRSGARKTFFKSPNLAETYRTVREILSLAQPAPSS